MDEYCIPKVNGVERALNECARCGEASALNERRHVREPLGALVGPLEHRALIRCERVSLPALGVARSLQVRVGVHCGRESRAARESGRERRREPGTRRELGSVRLTCGLLF